MQNRILIAIVIGVALVAALLWALGGSAESPEASRSTKPSVERRPERELVEAGGTPPLAAPREAPARSVGEPAKATPAVDTRSFSDGLPFRGQVVDVRTGEPVPSAVAKAEGLDGPIAAATDDDGRFAGEARLPSGFESIEFWNAHDPAHIRTATRRELESLGEEGGWLARIRIGPTFRLRLVGGGFTNSKGWKLRVVESAPGVPDRATGWIDVVEGDTPWARFDNPLPEAQAEATERIEVQNAEGTLRGSAPIQTIVGIHPGLVTVALDERFARVLGRVVDTSGHPLSRAQVSAIPRLGGLDAGDKWPGCRTDGEGRYAIAGLAPGAYWVHARPRRGEEAQTIEVLLPLGDTTAPDLVAPAETSAGAIEGFLRAGGDKDFPLAVVRLRAVDGRSYEHFDVVDTNRQSEIEGDPGLRVQLAGGVAVEQKGFFEFQRVPAGEYELSVISTDGSRWSPNPLRLRPPRLDLEIARAAGPAAWNASFLAFDRETAEPIPTFRAQLFVGGIEVEGHVTLGSSLTSEPVRFHWPLAPTARVTWIVSAPGYRAATGTETDFVGPERDRVAPVRLERGFAARFLLRDVRGRFGLLEDEWAGRMAALEHPPVPGASVRADGEIVGTSDENGIAWIETARPPERIEILAPGWTVLASKGLRDGRLVETGRDIVVWLSR